VPQLTTLQRARLIIIIIIIIIAITTTITYPWCRDLFEELAVPQHVEIFPRRFTAVFT
jgi:hypothetical protein